MLCACRHARERQASIDELKDIWTKLRGIEIFKSALEVDLNQQRHTLADKMHDWAKKINRDKEIRNLQLGLVAATGVDIAQLPKDSRGGPLPPAFITVDERSAAGAQVLVSIPYLPISELDWNETMYSMISAWAR